MSSEDDWLDIEFLYRKCRWTEENIRGHMEDFIQYKDLSNEYMKFLYEILSDEEYDESW